MEREGIEVKRVIRDLAFQKFLGSLATLAFWRREHLERPKSRIMGQLVLLFTSLLAIPLARQSCLDATLFTGLEVVGVTLYFLDDVFLLNLTLEPA